MKKNIKLLSKKNILIVVAAAGALVIASVVRRPASIADDTPLFEVARGPLTISISEKGTIQNREKVVVQSEVEGRNTIVYIIEEGVMVEEGDLLVQLDSSGLEESKIDQEIRVQNAEASLVQARENLAITENQAKADIDQAELDLRFARIDLVKYKEGEYPMQIQKAESNIKLAEEELRNVEDRFEWSKRLAEMGYITGVELQSDQLSVERNQISLETARGELDLLTRYTHDKEIERLRSNVTQAEMALERINRRATADIIKAEADLRARDSQYQREESRLERIKEQIAKCTMYAPAAGMVVYAQTSGGRWGTTQEPLEAGQEVTERRELIHLPKTRRMNAQIQIQESSLARISVGMPVVVELDAVRDVELEGEIARIAILPDATRSWLNPDLKVYNCDVELEESSMDLRPGMSCTATVIIEEYDDVVYVPIQAVVRIDGRHTAFVMENSRLVPREVRIGMNNNRMVHIKSGLEEGEQVSLAPPLRPTERREERRMRRRESQAGDSAHTPAAGR